MHLQSVVHKVVQQNSLGNLFYTELRGTTNPYNFNTYEINYFLRKHQSNIDYIGVSNKEDVNIHLDDTRLINRVEYDPITDRFGGFCLPLKDGLPLCDAFQFQTFQELKAAFETEVVAKYAHCVVAQPVNISCPAYVLYVLGTDSTYSSDTIVHRWNYAENELGKRGIKIISHGADGAGPFLKGMIDKTRLFTTSVKSNVPTDW